MIDLSDVLSAQARIAALVEHTPAVSSGELNAMAGARVTLKLENLQGAGSFKLRGALSAMTALPPERLRRGVAATANGNHALAVAHAARLLDTTALVVLPEGSGGGGARALGARVVCCKDEIADRTVIPAKGSALAMAGAGTVAVELIRDVGPVDVLVLPVGGGTLAAGCAAAAAALAPGVRVVGVLLRRGTPKPPALHAAVTVDDAETAAAMRLLHDALGVTVEPNGACAVAALCAGRVPVRPSDRVGVVVSGGNVLQPLPVG